MYLSGAFVQGLCTFPFCTCSPPNLVLEVELGLVGDQFEEISTLVDDDQTGNRFFRLLTNAVEARGSRVRVLFTLRADFFDRPLAYEHIGSHVSAGTSPSSPHPSRIHRNH